MNSMQNTDSSLSTAYESLVSSISETLQEGRSNAARAVNNAVLTTYWQIGRFIVEYEQRGQERAEYGSELMTRLSRDLTERHGTGFSKSNVFAMRRLYQLYPKFQTLSGKLTWSHYIELLKIEDPLERGFYEHQCESEGWGIRELKRQMKSMLFQRVALSKDKQGVLRLAQEGQIVERPEDILREPYIFEFTGLPQLPVYKEGGSGGSSGQQSQPVFAGTGEGLRLYRAATTHDDWWENL